MESVSWSGYYMQCGAKYPMAFQNPSYLLDGARVSPDRIHPGSMNFTADILGNDSAGRYNMHATFEGRNFRAEKHYPTWVIRYKGIITGTTIKGKWFFNGSDENSGDDFEIYMLNILNVR